MREGNIGPAFALLKDVHVVTTYDETNVCDGTVSCASMCHAYVP